MRGVGVACTVGGHDVEVGGWVYLEGWGVDVTAGDERKRNSREGLCTQRQRDEEEEELFRRKARS